ncbi:MAG: alpha/beta fold hydrolase [Pseudomonadota bacterium]|nr:alpha/beta fold hydrolase [Pseudomonadota bacterium]
MGHGIDIATAGARRQVNGVTLHVVEAGPADGPLVILLHGFPEFWWGWRRQIGPLAEAGFRVLAPDQRGYNRSDRPEGRRAYDLDTLARDVIGLMDAAGRETCCLVGHDWGGLVAWWTAARYPGRIARLVAVNAPHPDIAGPYMRSHPRQMLRSLYVGLFQIPRLPEAMLSADGHRALKDSLRRSSRPGTFPNEDLAHYEAAWSQPGALTSMLNWYRALPLKPRSPGKKLPMPVLVVWGRGDRFLESGLAEASLTLCETGRVRWFEIATHWVHLEEPDAVAAELIGFCRGG